jgi:hypothetical protein
MDGHKHEGLSDEALEREIEAALGVDPSPEFLPRVRARIASERVRDGWVWWRLAAAAASVAALTFVSFWIVRAPAPASPEATVATVTPGTPVASAPHLSAPEQEPRVVAVRTSRNVEPRQRTAVTAPEVVVSNDEAVALRRLVVAIANRQVKAVDIPALGVESVPLPELEEIVLEPIKLSPLAGLEGE